MQTLIRTTVFPCYAPEDRATAAALAEFLERGADVQVMREEGEMRPGEDLVSKARDARTADVALVLFSRNSIPPRWPRAQWEDALVNEPREEGVRIAFVRCDDCNPPAVLQPRFELSGLRRAGLREVKRWLRARGASWTPPEEPRDLDHAGYLEDLGIALADRAGVSTAAGAGLAYEFAREYREDFDEIFRLECGGRSMAALAGDLATQLGLRLEGELDSNLTRLADFCGPRRFLFLLEEGGADFVFGGRCSTLLVEEPGPPAQGEIRAAQSALAHADAASDWDEICHQARTGRRLHAMPDG
ncbi:MAG: toll/interleukin-1 receptor domain-containing protein [Candidatus Sulfopaludibacter sp.]|nr:toll/interleukin-1 receptor domain-containing protein [Candidatus Sulfopaludibacter sp.]